MDAAARVAWGRRVLCDGPARQGRIGILTLALTLTTVAFVSPVSAASRKSDSPPGHKLQAPKLGHEITGLRTRTSRTYLSPQGGRVARVYASSVNYRDEQGRWQPIDDRLKRAGSVLRNNANRYGAAFPIDLSKGMVRVDEGGDWVAFRLRGARASGEVHGTAATYRDALPGVDVRYEARADSVKESLTLAGPSARRRFVFDLDVSRGLRPHVTKGGAVTLSDRRGKTRMTLAAPFMDDAKGKHSQSVDYTLKRIGQDWRLTLTPRGGWLDSPKRAWPVTIDPQVVPGASSDCAIDSTTSGTSLCTAGTMKVGLATTAGPEARALVKFDVAGAVPAGSDISYAAMGLFYESSTNTNNRRLIINRMTRDWTNAATWNTADGTTAWTAAGGDFDAAVACEICASLGTGSYNPGAYAYWTVRNLVSQWSTGAQANFGLVVRDDPSDPDPANQYILDSLDSSNVSRRPVLDIRYDPHVGSQRAWKYESQKLTDHLSLQVNSQSGNLLLNQSNVTVPGGIGPDLAIGQSYNSLSDSQYSYGRGFSMNTGQDLRIDELGSGDLLLHGPSGYEARYAYVDGTTYTTPNGFDVDLKRTSAVRTDTNYWTYTERQSQRKLSFDGVGNLRADTDRNGRAITYQYVSGKLSAITDYQGRLTKFFYTSGRVTKMTDSAARDYLYTYNGDGTLATYTDPNNGVTKYTWAGGQIAVITTPAARKIKIEYFSGAPNDDRVKSVLRVTNPTAAESSWVGPKTQFTYSLNRNGTGSGVVTDPRNHTTTTTYDAFGRPTQAVDALGNTTKSTYTSNSNVLDFTLATNTGTTPNTTLTYDNDNNLAGSQTPTTSGSTCSTTPASCIQTKIDSGTAGGVPATVVGSKYLPGKTTNEQGRIQTLGYDTNGNPTTISSTTGTITLGYTEAGVTTPGKLSTITDQRSKVTSLSYFASGDLKQITPPLPLGATSLTYNASLSRIATVTDGKGQLRTLSYDNDDRVTNIAYAGGTNVGLVYDKDGYLTARNDSVGGNTTYTLDQLGRVTFESLPGGRSNSYGYDATSNLATLTDPSGTTTYGYDDANRNKSVLEPGAGTAILLGFDDDGRRTTTTYPNGVVQTRTYDLAGRLFNIKAVKATTTLEDIDYPSYANATGQGVLRDRAIDKVTGRSTQYQYDGQDRLFQARTYTTGGPVPSLSDPCATNGALACFEYAMDAASNRTSKTITGSTISSSVTSYVYNDANEIVSRISGVANNYSYDTNGNQLTRPLNGVPRTMTYNVRDQATAIDGTSIGYLGASQDQAVSEGSTILKNNVLGLGARTIGGTTDYYTREIDGTPLAQRTGSARQYYLSDALGSITATTDSTGNAQATYLYDPDGNNRGGTGSSTNPLGYAAGYKAPSALYRFGERYYDPADARWTQQDPLNQATDLRQANRYAYVGADPINLVDPTGAFFSVPGAIKGLVKGCIEGPELPGPYVKKIPGSSKVIRVIPQGRSFGCAEGFIKGGFGIP